MRINGVEFNKPMTVEFVFPYNGIDIVLKAKAVSDYTEFDKLCPQPVPPMKVLATGEKIPHLEAKEYVAAMGVYNTKHSDWTVLTSISATDDLKFDTVNMADPTTWGNWKKDITKASLPDRLITKIYTLVAEANLLSDEKLEQARNRFLARQVVAQNQG